MNIFQGNEDTILSNQITLGIHIASDAAIDGKLEFTLYWNESSH